MKTSIKKAICAMAAALLMIVFSVAVTGCDKEPEEPMFTLTVCDRHGIIRYGKVRRLMPIECWRLQGFTDEQFHKAEATGLKDGQLYKMAGNAVSVPVISAIGEMIKG